MSRDCEELQALMSGYVDGELDAAQREEVEAHVKTCAECRREFEQLRQLVGATSALDVEPLPDDVWDEFYNDVYNRLERRTGWTVFIAGLVILTVIGLYQVVFTPWASPEIKVVVTLPFIGLLVLFVSVLRQRLHVAKTDRYSRDVKR